MCAFLSINTELLLILLYVEKIVDWIIKETSRSSSWKRTRSRSFSKSHGNLNSVASRIFSKATHLTPSMSTRADKNQPVSESEYSNTSLIFWHRLIFYNTCRLPWSNLALGWAFLQSHMVHAQMLSQMIFRTKMCTLQHRTPCIHRLGDNNLNIPQEGLWHIHLIWETKIILNLCPAVGSVLCIEQRPICFTANETRI